MDWENDRISKTYFVFWFFAKILSLWFKQCLNVVKKNFVKEDKSIIKSSHPPLDTILVNYKWFSIIASPFKDPDVSKSETKKIIEQNNFVNQSLHTIGQQLDRIEEKISPSVSIEKPLISLPKKRKSLGLKPKKQKNIEKIEKMLSDFKIDQAGPSKTITSIS